MSEHLNQSAKNKATTSLKDENQDMKNKQQKPEQDHPKVEQTAEQIKGSDADIDRSVGFDNQPDVKDTAKQIKGSDADSA